MNKEGIENNVNRTLANIEKFEWFLFDERRERYIPFYTEIQDYKQKLDFMKGILIYNLNDSEINNIFFDINLINAEINSHMNELDTNNFDDILDDIVNTTLEDEMYVPKESFNPQDYFRISA